MRSRRLTGSLSDMACVEGFSRGRRTRFDRLQSTYCVESRDSQNARSSASDENLGMACRFFCIDDSFFPMHVTGGNDADQRLLATKGEHDMQQAPRSCPAERMVARLRTAVPGIRNDDQRITEEHGFRFSLRNLVFLDALSSVAFVPFETLHPVQLNHACILPSYTQCANAFADSRNATAMPNPPTQWLPDDGTSLLQRRISGAGSARTPRPYRRLCRRSAYPR